MSQRELADFMGHSDIDSCLVYYQNSAIHGHIVNRALGLSPIYSKIGEFSKQEFITPDKLNNLADDQQVGGAAHGIVLAGIGGCSIGQSLCSLSPAISCYTCPKFLPINHLDTHEAVADELRDVVINFEQFGLGDQSNPAFAQLTNTLAQLSKTIVALKKASEVR